MYRQKQQNTLNLNRQLQDLARENNYLKEHVDKLKSDPDSNEHQAREELHYTRPGEVIVTLPSEGTTSVLVPSSTLAK